MKHFLSKRQDIKFKLEKFDEKILPEALNSITYGIKAEKYYDKGKKKHSRIFYILNDDYRYLQWISSTKSYTKSRIYLNDIKDISRQVEFKIDKKTANKIIRLQTSSYDLTLEFATETLRDYFQFSIQYFAIKSFQHEFLEKRQDQTRHLANILFLNADKDGNRQLDFEETKQLLKELHITINRKYLNNLFKKYDVNENGEIDQNEFTNIIRDISRKDELFEIFNKYCPQFNRNTPEHEGIMTVTQFQTFQLEEQRVYMTCDDIVEYFKQIQNQQQSKLNNKILIATLKISFYQFSNIIFNDENCIFNPLHETIYQDMNYPLNDYFINSSHNTYLMANQVTSDSSVQAYINAFQKGCKCVEIDIWDGEKGEPIVTHGHTLTSKISFKSIIEVINEYAFQYSEFPVILSFENHCSVEYQKKMAYYLKTIFKEKLYLVPDNWEKFSSYASPNDLKYKIIVKNKGRVEQAVNEDSAVDEVSEDDDDKVSLDDLDIIKKNSEVFPIFPAFNAENKQQEINNQGEKFKMQLKKAQKQLQQDKNQENQENQEYQEQQIKSLQDQSGEVNLNVAESILMKKNETLQNSKEQTLINIETIQKINQEKEEKKTKKIKECKELLRTTAMFGCKIDIYNPNVTHWQISSINEVRFHKLVLKNSEIISSYHKKSFLRVYPSPLRLDSSNFDPMPCFLYGIQFIALNFQKCDFPMFLYLSKFQENGGIKSGYILKPEFMLKNSKNPQNPNLMTQIRKSIKIQIISGQQLRPENYEEDNFDVVDPYIQIFIRGTYLDEINNKPFRTQIISDNGFHPIWNSQTFTFEFRCPELALLIFRVMDSDILSDTQLGFYALPVTAIRNGYRVIPLRNKSKLDFLEHSYILAKLEVLDMERV